MADFEIDMTQYAEFFKKMEKAGKGDFKKSLQQFLEGVGMEFLRLVQDEIIRMQAVDTRLMLASFSKGAADNEWEVSDGGLKLTVGTNVSYAKFVNDGHWTNPKGVQVRFVPGHWSGDRFIYEPGAKTGMLLRQQWVEGYHYWESALRILESMMPSLLERKMAQWLNEYFGD